MPDPLPKMWLPQKKKLCADLGAAKIFLPKNKEYKELSSKIYTLFPNMGNFKVKNDKMTFYSVDDKPVQINILTCFVSEEMEVHISYGIVASHYYFVFVKLGIDSGIKLLGLAEERVVEDDSLGSVTALNTYFLNGINTEFLGK